MLRWLAIVWLVAIAATGCSSDDDVAAPAPAEPPAQPAELVVFAKCEDLWSAGDPVLDPATDLTTFSKIQRDLVPLMGDRIVEVGSGQAVHGRLHVTIARPSAEVFERIREIAEFYAGTIDVLCVELPPEDFDPQPSPVPWHIADGSLPVEDHWQKLTLMVHDSCVTDAGLILPPEITVHDDRIVIDLRAQPLPWGTMCTLQGRPPREVVVSLPEDPAGRPVVCADEICPRAQ